MEMLRNRARTLSGDVNNMIHSATAAAAAAATGVPSPPASPNSSPNGGAKRDRGKERDGIEAQINDRDTKIAYLEHEVREQKAVLDAAKRDLDEVKLRQLEHMHMQSVELARRKREARAAAARVKVFKRDMEDKESLNGYAELIREAAPASGGDSAYVLKLQKQTQKADANRDLLRQQMVEVKKTSDELMDNLTVEICEVVEEKSRVEIDMANQLKILRKETNESEEKLKAELERLEKRLNKATKKLRRLADAEESDDDKESCEQLASSISRNSGTEERGPKAAKLKTLQEKLEELKMEGSKAEEELRSTLKSRRDEIARLKEDN